MNGTRLPPGDAYKRLLDSEFRDWQLKVHGLVNRPLTLSLAQLQDMPSRTQITLHNCDEGWSALLDAIHPQTVLAYGMNGKPLPIGHGAPLRLRVELQIGYKNAKFVDRIEVVDRLDSIGKGRGGWWEDFDRAVWYAGQ